MRPQPTAAAAAVLCSILSLLLDGALAAAVTPLDGEPIAPDSLLTTPTASASTTSRRLTVTLPPPRTPQPLLCYRDIPLVSCFQDPCVSLTADYPCAAVPNAVCRPSYCGSCTADYYIGSRRLRSCSCCPRKKLVNGNPCRTTKCPAYPEAQCEINYCVSGNPQAKFYVNGTIEVTSRCTF